MQDLRKMLEDAQGKWEESTKKAAAGDEPIAEGQNYVFELHVPKSGITVREEKNGAVRARMTVEVVGGDDEAQNGKFGSASWGVYNADGTIDEQGLDFLAKTLNRLNRDMPELTEVPATLVGLDGMQVMGAVLHGPNPAGGVYANVYINGIYAEAGD